MGILDVFRKKAPERSKRRHGAPFFMPTDPAGSRSQTYVGPVGLNDQTLDTIAGRWGLTGVGLASSIYAVRSIASKSKYAESFFKLLKSQVVGSMGIHPSFAGVTDRAVTSSGGNITRPGNRSRIRSLWKDFAESPCASGDRSLVDLQMGAIQSLLTDGMVFFFIRYHNDYPMGFALIPVGREYFAETLESKTENISRGIRFRESGVIDGYYFHKDSEDIAKQAALFDGNSYTTVVAPVNDSVNKVSSGDAIFVPKDQIIVIHQPNRHDSWDGSVSPIITMLDSFQTVDGLDRRMASLLDMLAGVYAYLEKTEYAMQFEDADEEALTVKAARARAEDFAAKIMELPMGAKLGQIRPNTPNADMTKYREEILRGGSASSGVDYASISSSPGDANFGSLRVFMDNSRDMFRIYQNVLESKMMVPLTRAWLSHVSQMGGPLSMVSRADIDRAMKTTYSKRGWKSVDPKKDAETKQILMSLGVTDPISVAAENGDDPEVVIENLRVFQEMLERNPEVLELFKNLPAFGGGSAAPGDMVSAAEEGAQNAQNT